MKNERIIISIPDCHHSPSMGDYIQNDMDFELSSVGCGTTEYMGYGDIRSVKAILKEQYGKMLVSNIDIAYTKDLGFEEVDEEILYERRHGR